MEKLKNSISRSRWMKYKISNSYIYIIYIYVIWTITRYVFSSFVSSLNRHVKPPILMKHGSYQSNPLYCTSLDYLLYFPIPPMFWGNLKCPVNLEGSGPLIIHHLGDL